MFLDGNDLVLAMPTRLSHQSRHRLKIWDQSGRSDRVVSDRV